MVQTPLAKQARELAARQLPGVAADLLTKAAAFDTATAAAFGTDGNDIAALKRLLGTWARLRKAICDLTGEPLI